MLIQHPDSVTIVAVEGDEVVLVRQRRPGAPEKTLELPAGKLEADETPREAVARELAEECGLRASSSRALATFWAVPAYSTEFVHVWEATGLSPAEPVPLDSDEDVEVERRPVGEALASLSDAVSIAALALWQLRR